MLLTILMPLGHMRSETFEDIRIRGKSEFLLRTEEALALLRPTSRFAEVRDNLGRIHQGKSPTSINAWRIQPIKVTTEAGKAG